LLGDAAVLLLALLLVFIIFVFVLFAPSLWETMKPRDKGPRKMRNATLEGLGVKVRRLNDDFVKLSGNPRLPDGFELKENVVVEGCLTAGSRCHFSKSLKVMGDVDIGCYAIIDGNWLSREMPPFKMGRLLVDQLTQAVMLVLARRCTLEVRLSLAVE